MKLKLSFKVHLYSCLRFYIAYIILIGLSLILKYIANIDNGLYYSYVIIASTLFSIILGIYEYLIVLHTYLNLQPNPRAFWVQSIFANLINSIICMLVVLIINVILLASGYSMYFNLILPMLILFIFAYSVGALGYVLLHRIKYLNVVSIIVLVIALIFAGHIIHDFIILILNHYLTLILPQIILFILSIIFEGLIIFRLNRFIK